MFLSVRQSASTFVKSAMHVHFAIDTERVKILLREAIHDKKNFSAVIYDVAVEYTIPNHHYFSLS